jgi:hypothetical protein
MTQEITWKNVETKQTTMIAADPKEFHDAWEFGTVVRSEVKNALREGYIYKGKFFFACFVGAYCVDLQ